jgi:DNA-binding NtrC family response regulator
LLLLATDTVDGEVVDLALPAARTAQITPGARLNGQTGLLAERVADFEKETILAELERNHRHITNTAKALGLERSYLYKKCQQLGIDLRRIQPSEPD